MSYSDFVNSFIKHVVGLLGWKDHIIKKSAQLQENTKENPQVSLTW
jgi:hypothetical protein